MAQEEILFVVYPELLILPMLVEKLDDLEALHVCAVRKFSNYSGFHNSFKFLGSHDYTDGFLKDIIAIDALKFRRRNDDFEFTLPAILRELNKCYIGFSKNEF